MIDEFRTRENLQSGNVMGVLNVIMQLRKCCNHPNLFESRPVISPLVMPCLRIEFPILIAYNYARDDLYLNSDECISKCFLHNSSFCEWKLFEDVSKNVNLVRDLNLKVQEHLPKVQGLKFCADQKSASGSSFFKAEILSYNCQSNGFCDVQDKELHVVKFF